MNKPALEKLMIPGPVGQLEAMMASDQDQGAYIAVVCHPHPLYGGTMHNKVVTYSARALLNMGIPVLRFNYRGVGKSDGEYDHAQGEGDDLVACVEWLRDQYPGRELILIGFSFGAYVAASRAAELSATALISIAPAIKSSDYDAIAPPGCDWLVIQGSDDEVVPSDEVKQWAESSADVSQLIWLSEASHFFHGRLLELAEHIEGWLRAVLER